MCYHPSYSTDEELRNDVPNFAQLRDLHKEGSGNYQYYHARYEAALKEANRRGLTVTPAPSAVDV